MVERERAVSGERRTMGRVGTGERWEIEREREGGK